MGCAWGKRCVGEAPGPTSGKELQEMGCLESRHGKGKIDKGVVPSIPPLPSDLDCKLSYTSQRGTVSRIYGEDQELHEMMEKNYNFDLIYITEKIISVFFPPLEEQRYRDNLAEVASMLKSKHQDNFLLLNLSEKLHDINRLSLKVQEFGWPDNHAPPLDKICAICKTMEDWLMSNPLHVVGLHCKGNKGKTAVIISAYMHYSKISTGADQLLSTLAMKKFCEDKIASSVLPSQKRYVHYFGGLLSGVIKMNSSPLFLHQVLIPNLDNYNPDRGYLPFLKIYQSMQLVYTSGVYNPHGSGARKVCITIDPALLLKGDILVKCYNRHVKGTERDVVFRLQFHTCTVHGSQLWFGKKELDEACTDNQFPSDAKVEFIFSSGPEKCRNYQINDPGVTVDYSTSDPVVRWDSYENFSTQQDSSPPGISHTRGPLDGSLYAQVKKRRGPASTYCINKTHFSNPTEPPQLPPRLAEQVLLDRVLGGQLQREEISLLDDTSPSLSECSRTVRMGISPQCCRDPSSSLPVGCCLDHPVSRLTSYSSNSVASLSVCQHHNPYSHPSLPPCLCQNVPLKPICPCQKQEVALPPRARTLPAYCRLLCRSEELANLPRTPHTCQPHFHCRGAADMYCERESEFWGQKSSGTLCAPPQVPQEPPFTFDPLPCGRPEPSHSYSSSHLDLKCSSSSSGYQTPLHANSCSQYHPSRSASPLPSHCTVSLSGVTPAQLMSVWTPNESRSANIDKPVDVSEVADYISQGSWEGVASSSQASYSTLSENSTPPTPNLPCTERPECPELQTFANDTPNRQHEFYSQENICQLDKHTVATAVHNAQNQQENQCPPQPSALTDLQMATTAAPPQSSRSGVETVNVKLKIGGLSEETKDIGSEGARLSPNSPSHLPSVTLMHLHSTKPLLFETSLAAECVVIRKEITSPPEVHVIPEESCSSDQKIPSPDGYCTPTFPMSTKYYPLSLPLLPYSGYTAVTIPLAPPQRPEKHSMSALHSSSPATATVSPMCCTPTHVTSQREELSFGPDPPAGSCSLIEESRVGAKFVQDTSRFWYKPDITRDQAVTVLKEKEAGAFIIRDSNSFPGAYGLALKVSMPPPNAVSPANKGDPIEQLVRHFLIEKGLQGVKIKGCQNEPYFGSLSALVYQHSITPISLPCTLCIPETDPIQELQCSQSNCNTSTAAELLKQGAACNVLYLNSVETESLTGPQAVSKATSKTLSQNPHPTATVVHFKVSAQGVTLTDSQRRLFFRRHYPVNSVIFSSVDPENRRWRQTDRTPAKVFGFVAKKPGNVAENICHLFAELDPEQPATAIVNFINKVLLGRQH